MHGLLQQVPCELSYLLIVWIYSPPLTFEPKLSISQKLLSLVMMLMVLPQELLQLVFEQVWKAMHGYLIKLICQSSQRRTCGRSTMSQVNCGTMSLGHFSAKQNCVSYRFFRMK
jgi:hypothetical protein